MKYLNRQSKNVGLIIFGLLLPALAQAAVWSSSAKFGTFSTGGYIIENDVWGANPGPQTIWANSSSNWGFWANHTGSGIKAYPNADKGVNIRVTSLRTCTSSFNATTAGGSKYDLAYDVWCNNNQFEVMIWANWSGTQPIAAAYTAQGVAVPTVSNVSIGGRSYNVYRRNNGANGVFSFLMLNKTNAATVDIKAVLLWLNGQHWFNNPTLTKVQFGWEIITTPSGGANYNMNSYSVTAN
jgi:Glycosyl hydrolase family 12